MAVDTFCVLVIKNVCRNVFNSKVSQSRDNDDNVETIT